MSKTYENFYGTSEGTSSFRSLPVKLHRTREAFTAHFRPTFQAYNLTDQQWRVLRILGAADELDVAELAKRSLLLGPSLSRILKDLLERRLVTRRLCSEDARRAFHALAPAGRALIDEVAPQLGPVFTLLKDRVGAEKVEQLNALLDEVLDALTR